MNPCTHTNLVQLPKSKKKLKCRHCQLIINDDELNNGCCPECYENTGDKWYDFDEIPDDASSHTQYRCEDCGIIIGSEEKQ